MEMEKRSITNKMGNVNGIAAQNLSYTTMDQHFILERNKLNDNDYDQNLVLVPMEMEKRYITNKIRGVNGIATKTSNSLKFLPTSLKSHNPKILPRGDVGAVQSIDANVVVGAEAAAKDTKPTCKKKKGKSVHCMMTTAVSTTLRGIFFGAVALAILVKGVGGIAPFTVSSGACQIEDTVCMTSPNYPSNYGSSQECKIRVNKDGRLNVMDFVTESFYDYLTVGGQKYGGTTGPDNIVVSANDNIAWESDGSTNKKGFKICMDPDPCPSVDGSIVNSETCKCGTTTCSATTGLFCLSSMSRCGDAAITPCMVVDGSTDNLGDCTCGKNDCTASTGFFCYSPINHCSTSAGVPPRFAVSSGECQILLDGLCVTSPNYPSNYGNSQQCKIQVKAAGNLNVVDFETQKYGYDYLLIGTNKYYTGPESPNGPHKLAVSIGDELDWLSSSSSVFKGFNICMGIPFLVSSGDCQIVDTFCVTSPNYPNTYSASKTCKIQVKTTGSLIVVDFETRQKDLLTVGPVDYSGTEGPSNVVVKIGDSIDWTPNIFTSTGERKGFKFCMYDPCKFADGSAINAKSCSCGTMACTTTTGLYCYSDVSVCATAPIADMCKITDGSASNSAADLAVQAAADATAARAAATAAREAANRAALAATARERAATDAEALATAKEVTAEQAEKEKDKNENCRCGSVSCDTNSGSVCYAGSCRKYLGQFTLTLLKSSGCSQEKGRRSIANLDFCEDAATMIGNEDTSARLLTSTSSQSAGRYSSPGCLIDASSNSMGGQLYFNPSNTGYTPWCHDEHCLCVSASDCLVVDGSASNGRYCFCGTSFCTDHTGFYCTSSTNTCSSGPPCLHTGGQTINSHACACGGNGICTE